MRTEPVAQAPLPVSFLAGSIGEWKIDCIETVAGESLPFATNLRIVEGTPPNIDASIDANRTWTLRGVTSHTRYTTRQELTALHVKQQDLGRSNATFAALIPIRKSPAWWALAQDERKAIFEEQSHHIAVGPEYLPEVARRLHHCRDLAGPFDFLIWFEYPPEAAAAFEEMVRRMRATREWNYVDREIDLRLSRS